MTSQPREAGCAHRTLLVVKEIGLPSVEAVVLHHERTDTELLVSLTGFRVCACACACVSCARVCACVWCYVTPYFMSRCANVTLESIKMRCGCAPCILVILAID